MVSHIFAWRPTNPPLYFVQDYKYDEVGCFKICDAVDSIK